jgi:hypothetical protein
MNIVARSAAQNGCKVRWQVTFNGKTYFITTYPDSDLLFIETGDTRRHVAELTGRNIKSAFMQALITDPVFGVRRPHAA